MSFHNEESWIGWFDRLSNDGYCVVDGFINEQVYGQLRSHFLTLASDEEFSAGGIGSSLDHHLIPSIRSDYNRWLEPEKDLEISEFFGLADETREMLNRYCYLSLRDYEFQFALYPPGSFYKKHLDQFRERSNRLISLVIYLNENWKKGDGGEIRIYSEQDFVDIAPIAKRAVLFRSDTIEHEVLPTLKSRYSLSGWFLYQPLGLGYL